jgi:hypothetical protein
VLYQSRQGENACREFENRHYGKETRKKCTAASIWAATYHYIHSSQLLTRPAPKQVPTSILCRVYTACMLRLGPRAYGPWLRCTVTACKNATYTWMTESYLNSPQYRVGDVRILQYPAFPVLCQVHALPLLQPLSRETGAMDPRCFVIDRMECIQAMAGSLAVPPISNRQGL